MSVFYDLSKTPRNILSQAIVRAIISENNGALFDPSDLSTLYQDAAGTTPVTAVEQPVGLMLDKSRGLMLGPELIVNGTFDSNLSGWSTPGGGWYWENGKAKIVGDGSLQPLLQNIPTMVSTKSYIVEFDAEVSGSGVFVLESATGTAYVAITTGHIKCVFTGCTRISFKRASGSTTVTLDNISVRELYGYHATQPITASRPTLSARKNILLATETLATQSVTTLAATYTLSFTGTGSVTLSGTSAGTLTGNSTDRASLTFTPTAGTLTLTVSGSVTKAQLGLGSVVTSYQRVTTATDYDASAHYYYLRFDGVDDYLNLPYMGLYAGGSASVVAGLSTRKPTFDGRIIAEGNSGTDTANYLILSHLPTSGGAYQSSARNDGAVTSLSVLSGVIDTSKPTNIVSVVDAGNYLSIFKDSVLSGSGGYTRNTPVTLNTTTIGLLDRQTDTGYFTGNLYGLIITKSDLTDSQRVACERYLGRKSGVQL